MFSDAWTIIDQVHVMRQVLLSLTGVDRKSDTQAFIDDFPAAHAMRNRIDHLNQNLPNRAKAIGRTNSLFGVLTFFRPYADRWEQGLQQARLEAISFWSGQAQRRATWSGVVAFNDLDIHLPICSFKLEAFDLSLLIERAVLQLRPLLKRLSDDTKGKVEAKVDELAATVRQHPRRVDAVRIRAHRGPEGVRTQCRSRLGFDPSSVAQDHSKSPSIETTKRMHAGD